MQSQREAECKFIYLVLQIVSSHRVPDVCHVISLMATVKCHRSAVLTARTPSVFDGSDGLSAHSSATGCYQANHLTSTTERAQMG